MATCRPPCELPRNSPLVSSRVPSGLFDSGEELDEGSGFRSGEGLVDYPFDDCFEVGSEGNEDLSTLIG